MGPIQTIFKDFPVQIDDVQPPPPMRLYPLVDQVADKIAAMYETRRGVRQIVRGWARDRCQPARLMVPRSSLLSDREITNRWIWLVPSKICITLASRMYRSTGKSLV